jgi:hypothetical protein
MSIPLNVLAEAAARTQAEIDARSAADDLPADLDALFAEVRRLRLALHDAELSLHDQAQALLHGHSQDADQVRRIAAALLEDASVGLGLARGNAAPPAPPETAYTALREEVSRLRAVIQRLHDSGSEFALDLYDLTSAVLPPDAAIPLNLAYHPEGCQCAYHQPSHDSPGRAPAPPAPDSPREQEL